MFDYLFFDLDGTLTDPATGITNSFIYAYKYFGMEIPDYKADVCVAFAQGNMGKAIMLATSEYFFTS